MLPRTELNHLLNLRCRPRFLAAAPKVFALAKIDICFHRMRPPPASALKLQSPCGRSAARPIRHAALQHACRCHTAGSSLQHLRWVITAVATAVKSPNQRFSDTLAAKSALPGVMTVTAKTAAERLQKTPT